MIRIRNKFQLKTAPQNEVVYVETVNKLYQCQDGEWIQKQYFTRNECASILKISVKQIYAVCSELNIRRRASVSDIQILAQALKMLREKKKFKQIKEELL